MRWSTVELVEKIETSKDRLGNSIVEMRKVGDAKARLTQWTSEDINLYGRDLTKTARKLISKSEINQNMLVRIDEVYYSILRVEDLGRFYFCIIERYNYAN